MCRAAASAHCSMHRACAKRSRQYHGREVGGRLRFNMGKAIANSLHAPTVRVQDKSLQHHATCNGTGTPSTTHLPTRGSVRMGWLPDTSSRASAGRPVWLPPAGPCCPPAPAAAPSTPIACWCVDVTARMRCSTSCIERSCACGMGGRRGGGPSGDLKECAAPPPALSAAARAGWEAEGAVGQVRI